MRAITIEEPGGPEVLRWAEAPDPAGPGPGEVLIDVLAAGLNNADLLQRAGNYPVPPGASPILGLECSGRVAAVGADVAGLAVGDVVCALLTGGGYAERVVVPAAQVLPVPEGVDPVDAAGLPEAACTVLSNLRGTASLQAGQTLLVHGGGSGIGTFAIQWAAGIGARVTVLDKNVDRLRQLDLVYGNRIATLYSNAHAIEDAVVSADLVISVPSGEFEEALDELRGIGDRVTTDSVEGRTLPRSSWTSNPASGTCSRPKRAS